MEERDEGSYLSEYGPEEEGREFYGIAWVMDTILYRTRYSSLSQCSNLSVVVMECAGGEEGRATARVRVFLNRLTAKEQRVRIREFSKGS